MADSNESETKLPDNRLFITSIPKCGTHLLLSLIYRLGFERFDPEDLPYRQALFGELSKTGDIDKAVESAVVGRERALLLGRLDSMPANSVVAHHFPYDPHLAAALKRRKIVSFFMIRDPRDQIISYRNHVLKDPQNKHLRRFESSSPSECYQSLISGSEPLCGLDDSVTSITEQYNRFHGWLSDENTSVICFRHLVGPKGGGTRVRQLVELDRIVARMNANLLKDIDESMRLMFSPKHSLFSKGQIDVWKSEFDEQTKRVFEETARPDLENYFRLLEPAYPTGYEEALLNVRYLRRALLLADRDCSESFRDNIMLQERADLLEKRLKTLSGPH